MLLFIGSVFWYSIRAFTRPLSAYIENFIHLSKGDLTAYSLVDSRDEVGRSSEYFNSFVETFNQMFGSIRTVTQKHHRKNQSPV